MKKVMDQMSVTLILCFVTLIGRSFGQFEDFLLDENENVKGHDGRSFSVNDSFSENPLIGRPDGHEPTEKPLFGRPDGHEPTEKPLFGRPDGHEPTEKPLFGRPDGHEPTEKPLFGRPDGHEPTEKPLFGRPDGHEPTEKPLLGRPDGHESAENVNAEEVTDWAEDYDGTVPLVRCKRPICSTDCDYGFQTDVNGCPVCKCLEDPCQGVRCTDGYVCHWDECEDIKSCVKLSARCIPRRRNCPEPMCANFCPNGYAHNDEGCMTCTCQAETSIQEEVHDDDHSSACPMVMCKDACVNGYQKNDRGCDTCDCVDKSVEQSSCDELFCDVGQVCQTRNSKYYCAPKSLCHLAQEMAYMKRSDIRTRMMNLTKQFVPECEADGSFSPMQCHQFTSECWCVDDRGKEITGTRAIDNENHLHCEPNVTALVSLHVVLMNDKGLSYDDVEEKRSKNNLFVNSAKSKDVIENAFGSWLLIEKQYMLLVKMEQSADSSISVQLELKNDGSVDLPSSVEYMKRQMRMGQCHVTLESINAENVYFVPDIDTLIVDYQYNVEPVIAPALVFENPFEGCGKILLIVATMLFLFMILALLSVLLVHYHWRHKRTVQFRHHKLENQLSHDPRNFADGEVAGKSAVTLVSSSKLQKTHLLA